MLHRPEPLPDVVFAQPDRLPRPGALGERVVVLDLAFALPIAPSTYPLSHPQTRQYYRTCVHQTTRTFIDALGDRLVRWIDHHDHLAWRAFQQDRRFRLVPAGQAPACALLVDGALFSDPALAKVDTIVSHGDLDGLLTTARFLLGGELPYPDALDDAIAADTRQGALSHRGETLDRALKARGDRAIRAAALRWLVQGDEGAGEQIVTAADAYEVLRQATDQLVADYRDVGSCRIVDARRCGTPFDLTRGLCALQQGGRTGVVIHGDGERETISVASHRPAVNLPRLLGLPGGSPHRVRLDAGHLPDLVAALDRCGDGPGPGLPLPRRATIEIVRRCNLHCPLCPVGNGRARELPDMSWETFRSIVDAFAPHLESMTLHNYGEPLLHPQLARFIRHAKASGVPSVDLTTNGNHLPERLARDLVASGLDAIRFSVDTAEPEAYRQYRKGGRLDRVLAHVERLAKARSSMQAAAPRIEAQALLMRDNEAHALAFERVLLGAGADTVRWKTFNVFMSGEALGDAGKRFLPLNPDFRRYADLDPRPASEPGQIRLCRWPWDRLVVLADGTIVPCCHDYNAEYPLGAGVESEPTATWDTPARRAFMVRRILRPASIPMCRRCSSAVPGIGLRKEATLRSGRQSAP